MSTTTLPFPVRFYSNTAPASDSRGRTLVDILSFDRSQLETRHDYIQLLFPLPERSPFNPSAPIIDKATFHQFACRPDLQARLRSSLTMMLSFYGFELVASSNAVERHPDFLAASKNWLKPFNHNHLRITRIIRSCRILGLEEEAEGFYRALVKVADDFPEKRLGKSMLYWRRAAKRPLYLAPEDDEDFGHGKDFLYEVERGRLNIAGEE
ncbi:MAG: hypothetical protein Q9183_005409 [Haloplaca sp. 2 TL-2023]